MGSENRSLRMWHLVSDLKNEGTRELGEGHCRQSQRVGKTWPVPGRLEKWGAVRLGRPADVSCWP